MNGRMLLPMALALALPWVAGPAAAQSQGVAKLALEQSEEYGAYLADADGRALYMFTADQQGADQKDAVSNCYDACTEAWPPLLTAGEPQAGDKIDTSLVSRIERQGGGTQVTYNGWPLYLYVQDEGAGEATGQDVHGFGGEWYLLTAEGKKVGES